MLQRVQTVYLLLLAILLGVLLCVNFATITPGGDMGVLREVADDGTIVRSVVTGQQSDMTFGAWAVRQGRMKVVPTTYLGVLIVLTLAAALATIFLYRRRWLQIRLCFAMGVMLVGIQAFIVMYIYKISSALKAVQPFAIKYSIFDLFQLLGLVLLYLAFRGIARDEALVRSLNRIR